MADDDLPERAAAYEAKVANLGSTEEIIGGLVKGAERNRQVTRWLIVSVALDVALSLGLLAVARNIHSDADRADRGATRACVQSAKNSTVINKIITELIANTQSSSQRTPDEKAKKVKDYGALIIDTPDCYSLPTP